MRNTSTRAGFWRRYRGWSVAGISTAVLVVGCSTPTETKPDPDQPTEQVTASLAPDSASASLGIDSAAAAAALPFSNRFAYVWADQALAALGAWYVPNVNYSYNALGAANFARRTGVGIYEVRLGGMAKAGIPARKETIIATAYSAGAVRCNVSSWGDLGADLLVRILCANPAGILVNTRFNVLMVGAGSLLGRHGFAWANQPAAAFYAPSAPYAATTGPGPISIARPGVGNYNVNLTLPRPVGGSTENYFVTTYGSVNNHCKIGSWGAIANVRCFSRFGGVPADNYYDVLLVDGGRPFRRLGFAWADNPVAAVYAPNPAWRRNSSGGGITIHRTAPGTYYADFAGLTKLAGHKENVQVTAYGGGFVSCNVVSWGNVVGALRVGISCRNVAGALVDSRYTVLVIE